MRRKIDVYLGLGSNLGDREMNLLRAVNLLDKELGVPAQKISRLMEFPAQGFDGPDFMNMCVLYKLPEETDPMDVLKALKRVEAALGRTDAPEYGPDGERVYHDRTVDVDILFFGTEKIEKEGITIPHPKIVERVFVKVPLKEIASAKLKEAYPEIFTKFANN